jgi:sugar phosphate isomerase/epimerase
VVLEAFLDWPLDRVLSWLPGAAPEITHLEVGAGGYALHPHCDVVGLLASDQARSAWLGEIAKHGLRVDALNAWGNPLHPDLDLAREHDRALRDAIRLATLLGVDRVVPLAGCPGCAAGDQVPHFGAGGKVHSYGYRVAPMLRRLPVTPVVTVMSGRDAGAVAAAAAA